tara:strand:+ start:353 stop:1453 length:1101 start_codon:yes stop_codon:yes gene_type:complete
MKIALLGDIAIFGCHCLSKNKKFKNYFDKVKKHLSSFDIVIGNLEAPFADNEKPILGKSATVKSHPINVELLNYLGITHVNLANNHIGDFGTSGYERTKELLSSHNIEWFGTEDRKIDIEINDEKISLLGFCSYNTNPAAVISKSKLGLNYLDASDVYENVKKNFERGFLSIVAIHSGQEHIHMPSSEDVIFARKIAKDFNYVYFGHHPHVIQGFEKVNGSAIFYSLGNFIFDDVYTPRDINKPLIKLTESNKTGIIGEIEVQNSEIIKCNSTIVYMSPESMKVDDEIHGVDLDDYNSILQDVGSDEYNQKRSSLVQDFKHSRRQMRDLKWYMKRLNLNSILILLKARQNLLLYKKHFTSKIDLIG